MTATLPTFQRREIERALQNSNLIKPTEKFLQEKIRHKISIFDGNVYSAINNLKPVLREINQVMLVLNTVYSK